MTDETRQKMSGILEIAAEDAKTLGFDRSLINELQMLARLVQVGDFDPEDFADN